MESNSIEIGKFTWEGRFWKTIGVGVCVLGGSIALFCFSHLSRAASENVLSFFSRGVSLPGCQMAPSLNRERSRF